MRDQTRGTRPKLGRSGRVKEEGPEQTYVPECSDPVGRLARPEHLSEEAVHCLALHPVLLGLRDAVDGRDVADVRLGQVMDDRHHDALADVERTIGRARRGAEGEDGHPVHVVRDRLGLLNALAHPAAALLGLVTSEEDEAGQHDTLPASERCLCPPGRGLGRGRAAECWYARGVRLVPESTVEGVDLRCWPGQLPLLTLPLREVLCPTTDSPALSRLERAAP